MTRASQGCLCIVRILETTPDSRKGPVLPCPGERGPGFIKHQSQALHQALSIGYWDGTHFPDEETEARGE